MKLNLGSGYNKLDGYVNIDADPRSNPDVRLNLDNEYLKLPFDTSTIDEIIAIHFLEHVGEGFFKLMQEVYRVCKPNALFKIIVPHPNHEVFKNDPTHKRPIMPEGLRLFSQAYNREEIAKHGHSSTLGIMFDVDFDIVEYKFIHDDFYKDIIPTLSKLELHRLFREGLNVCTEIHIVLKVVKT